MARSSPSLFSIHTFTSVTPPNSLWSAMDARVSVEEARSIITRFNNKGSSSDRANHNNHDNNPDTKLRMWYPSETMQQVMYFYVDLVVDMHVMLC